MRSSGFCEARIWSLERSPMIHDRPMTGGGCSAAACARDPTKNRTRRTLRMKTGLAHDEQRLYAQLALDALRHRARVVLRAVWPDVQPPQVADGEHLDCVLEPAEFAFQPRAKVFCVVARRKGPHLQVNGLGLLWRCWSLLSRGCSRRSRRFSRGSRRYSWRSRRCSRRSRRRSRRSRRCGLLDWRYSLSRFNAFQLHLRATQVSKTQLERGGIRKVDHPPLVKRPAIVDAHDDAAPGCDARDACIARARQRRIRCAHRIHVVRLPARRSLPVKLLAVPARHAALPVRLHEGERDVLLAEHLVWPIGVAVQRLGLRLGIGNLLEVRRRPLAGAVILVIAPGPGRSSACAQSENDEGEKRLHPSYTTL